MVLTQAQRNEASATEGLDRAVPPTYPLLDLDVVEGWDDLDEDIRYLTRS